MNIFLVVYDKTSVVLSEKLFSSIKQYIDDRYVDICLSKNRDIVEEYYQLECEPLVWVFK